MTSNYLCLRYLILGCFVLLGISGLIVCSASSYFIHQNIKYNDDQSENIQGPPATLLVMGLLNCIFAIYFWFIIDYKYNSLQLIMITLMLSAVAFIEISMGLWALVMHEQLDTVLSMSLDQPLAAFKIKDNVRLMNITTFKFNCCGHDNTIVDIEKIFLLRHCCDFEKMDAKTRITCNDIYGRECKHLTINRNRSILHKTFLLALCSVLLQIFIITSVICYGKFLKKRKIRHRQSLVLAKPSAPYAPSVM